MINFQDFSFLAVPLLLISSLAQAEVVERVEAIINKKAIYLSDVQRFKELTPLRAKIDPLFGNEPLAKKAKPTELEVVEFLIDEALIVDKFPVTDAEVEQEITSIQGNLKIDRDQLKAAINREGFKFEDYFKLMRVSVAKRQLIDRDIRNKAVVSDDDLLAEYNRGHSTSKTFQGEFHLFLIRITKSNFKTPAAAKEEAQRALDAIHKGEAFIEVAKRVSDDASQNAGGDLGFLSYGEMSPALQKEVQKLGPEKTSALVDSGNSFLIIKVGEVRSGSDTGFEREKEALRGKLMESEFQHQVRLWIDRERSQNFVKINIT